jgi:phage-related protein
LTFLGDSRKVLQGLPTNLRRQAGLQLYELQQGHEPDDWKSMATFGMGVNEIRLRDGTGIARVFYVAKFEEAVYILRAFEKKTQKTDDRDIEIGRRRYKALIEERRR